MNAPPPLAESISLQQALLSGSRSQIESLLFDAISDVDSRLHPWVELMAPATAAVLVDMRGTGGGLTAALATRVLKLSTFMRFAKRAIDSSPDGDTLRHAILSIPSIRAEHIDQLAPLATTSEEAWSVFVGPILEELDKRVVIKRAGIRARRLEKATAAGEKNASPLTTTPIEPAPDAVIAVTAPREPETAPPPLKTASRPGSHRGSGLWTPATLLLAGVLAMLIFGTAGSAITLAVVQEREAGYTGVARAADTTLPTPIRNAELLIPRASTDSATTTDSPFALLTIEILHEVATLRRVETPAATTTAPAPDQDAQSIGDERVDADDKAAQDTVTPPTEEDLPPRHPPQDAGSVMGSIMSSAIDGDPAAQRKVGAHYFLGLELPRDRVLAAAWLDLASRQDASATRMRDKVSRLLPPDQRKEAARIANEWQPGDHLHRLDHSAADALAPESGARRAAQPDF
ncbi:MAG: SEL1-like repeat protein [Burkholderiaceae bacterium]